MFLKRHYTSYWLTNLHQYMEWDLLWVSCNPQHTQGPTVPEAGLTWAPHCDWRQFYGL